MAPVRSVRSRFSGMFSTNSLLVASLWALAAVALPGVGGLVILTVVGVRIGCGKLKPDSHRGHRALRASPVPRAVKRWMSAR